MAYTPPVHDAVVFNDDGVAYTPPAHDAVLFNKNAEQLTSRTLTVSTGIIAPYSSAIAAHLVGTQVTAQTGGVGTLVDGATVCSLTGTSVSAVSGKLPVTWALIGVVASVAKGEITPTAQVSLSVPLIGHSTTVSAKLIKPHILISLVGQQTPAGSGNLVSTASISVALVGASLQAIAPTSLSLINGSTIELMLAGVAAGVGAGVLAIRADVSIGDSTNALSTFPKTATTWTNTTHDPVRSGAWTYNNTFIAHQGRLVGVGELANWDVFGQYYYAARIDYAVEPRLIGSDWSSTLTESWDYENHGDNTFATYLLDSSTFEPWYLVSPTSYRYNRAYALGGHFSLGLDGSKHWVYERAYYDGATITNYLVYQNSIRNRVLEKQILENTAGQIMGVYAHDKKNAYIFYAESDGSGHTVPSYRKWDGATFGSEVQLTGWTGTSALTTIPYYLTVTRAGYGDTIYITYCATGDHPQHIGLIVMDAVTETVTSHVVTRVTSFLSYVTPGTTDNANTSQDISQFNAKGHRPLAEVARLSSGTSVTQFALQYGVVHLSWTSGTATSPTLTLKTAPSLSNNGLAPGWETLEIRGDTVQHILYDIDLISDTYFDVYYTKNDASGSGSSWSTEVKLFRWGDSGLPIFPSSEFNSAKAWNGGYGEGLPTWLFFMPRNQRNTSPANGIAGKAWIDWWPGFSVPTYGAVGNVTVTLQEAIVITPAGKVVTVAAGTLGYKTSITLAITGVQLAATSGLLGTSEAIDVTLVGAQVSAQTGVLACTISQTLASTSVAVQRGVLATAISTALVGQTLSAASGVLTPAISLALTGRALAAQKGLLNYQLDFRLSGVQAAVGRGSLDTSTSFRLSGAQVAVARGVLTPTISITLAGKTFSVLTGGFGQQIHINLLGKVLTIEISAFGVESDITLSVSGVETIGQVGVYPISTNVRMATAHLLLWARMEVEKLVTKTESNTLEAKTVEGKLYSRLEEADPLFNDEDEML